MEYPAKFRAQYMMHWGARTNAPKNSQHPAARRGAGRGALVAPRLPAVTELSGVAMASRYLGGGGISCGTAGPLSGAPTGWGPGRGGSGRLMGHVHASAADAGCGAMGGVCVGDRARTRKRIVIAHAEEGGMEDDGLNFRGHMLAGSVKSPHIVGLFCPYSRSLLPL
jgi:hypothetical protein